MRTIHIAALAALASTALTAPARAEDIVHVTPPLYREMARTSAVRPASELATTPQPVAPAPASRRIVAEASPAR